jgi:predicted nucleic acid-binding protein
VVFLIDTSAFSALMREDAQCIRWVESIEPGDQIVTCAVVRGEILFGIYRLPEDERRNELEAKGSRTISGLAL